MERLQAGGGLDAVAEAYRAAAGEVRMAKDFRLRWRYRRLQRQASLDSAGLAELRAVTDEFTARGMELPT